MNTKDLSKFIQAADLCNQAPLISGKHGTGKSDSVRQYAKQAGLHNETLILSLMDTGDLCGLPRTSVVGGQTSTTWAAPVWFSRIVDRAWPQEINMEDLEFKDKDFEKYVYSKLSRD